jgi:hypothetical protein
MPQPKRVGSLEIAQDIDFQRREWRAQRIGWVVMALLVLAAMAGLTGNGVLARATAGGPADPIRLEYARFDRMQSPSSLRVEVAGDAVGGEVVELLIDRAYLQGVQIEKVVPEPESVRGAENDLLYVFAVAEPGRPLTVSFDLRHNDFGVKGGRVALPDGPALEFGQIVYP